jgi:hypothetical protein
MVEGGRWEKGEGRGEKGKPRALRTFILWLLISAEACILIVRRVHKDPATIH